MKNERWKFLIVLGIVFALVYGVVFLFNYGCSSSPLQCGEVIGRMIVQVGAFLVGAWIVKSVLFKKHNEKEIPMEVT